MTFAPWRHIIRQRMRQSAETILFALRQSRYTTKRELGASGVDLVGSRLDLRLGAKPEGGSQL